MKLGVPKNPIWQYVLNSMMEQYDVQLIEVSEKEDVLKADALITDQKDYLEQKKPTIEFTATFDFEKQPPKLSQLIENLRRWEDVFVYSSEKIPRIQIHNQRAILNFDPLSLSFILLSRFEETINPSRDNFDRFLWEYSAFNRFSDIVTKPQVDIVAKKIVSIFAKIGITISKRNLWSGKNFAVALTHDIDLPFKYQRVYYKNFGYALAQTIMKGNLKEAFRSLFALFKTSSDPYNNFSKMEAIEKGCGFNHSAYYVMSDSSSYKLEKQIIRTLNRLVEGGCEIGFHPGLNTYNNNREFNSQVKKLKNALNIKIWGGRQHYLQHDVFATPSIWSTNHLVYDSSVCYPDHEGFRLGTCFPQKTYNWRSKSPMSIISLPLIVMEGTLQKYRGISPQQGIEATMGIIGQVRNVGGIATLLWHNTFFDDTVVGEWAGTYQEILKRLSLENVYCHKPINLLSMYYGL